MFICNICYENFPDFHLLANHLQSDHCSQCSVCSNFFIANTDHGASMCIKCRQAEKDGINTTVEVKCEPKPFSSDKVSVSVPVNHQPRCSGWSSTVPEISETYPRSSTTINHRATTEAVPVNGKEAVPAHRTEAVPAHGTEAVPLKCEDVDVSASIQRIPQDSYPPDRNQPARYDYSHANLTNSIDEGEGHRSGVFNYDGRSLTIHSDVDHCNRKENSSSKMSVIDVVRKDNSSNEMSEVKVEENSFSQMCDTDEVKDNSSSQISEVKVDRDDHSFSQICDADPVKKDSSSNMSEVKRERKDNSFSQMCDTDEVKDNSSSEISEVKVDREDNSFSQMYATDEVKDNSSSEISEVKVDREDNSFSQMYATDEVKDNSSSEISEVKVDREDNSFSQMCDADEVKDNSSSEISEVKVDREDNSFSQMCDADLVRKDNSSSEMLEVNENREDNSPGQMSEVKIISTWDGQYKLYKGNTLQLSAGGGRQPVSQHGYGPNKQRSTLTNQSEKNVSLKLKPKMHIKLYKCFFCPEFFSDETKVVRHLKSHCKERTLGVKSKWILIRFSYKDQASMSMTSNVSVSNLPATQDEAVAKVTPSFNAVPVKRPQSGCTAMSLLQSGPKQRKVAPKTLTIATKHVKGVANTTIASKRVKGVANTTIATKRVKGVANTTIATKRVKGVANATIATKRVKGVANTNETSNNRQRDIAISVCEDMAQGQGHGILRNIHLPHSSEEQVCTLCKETFTSPNDIPEDPREPDKNSQSETRNEDEDSNLYKCRDCDKAFQRKNSFTRHQRLKHNCAFVCSTCKLGFQSKGCLNDHNKQFHANSVCEQCGKYFRTLNALRVHSKEHSEDFYCKLCDLSFETSAEFKSHQESKAYKCDTCERLFHSWRQVANCKTRHLEREFPCDFCKARFRTADTLKQHKVVYHDNDQPFKCDICDKTFAMMNFHRHKLIHSEIKFPCKNCSKVFSRNDNLNNHIRNVHMGVKNFQCHICGKRFYAKHTYQQHMLCHPEYYREVQGPMLSE